MEQQEQKMELKLFSNSAISATGLSEDLRNKMEAKIRAERPDIDTKAAALVYLMEKAVEDKQTVEVEVEKVVENPQTAKELAEAKKKIEAYEAENEYLKNKEPEKVYIKTDIPLFEPELEKYLRQVAFLSARQGKFIQENSINALVKQVFKHYQAMGNFVFDEEDKKILAENGLM